MRTAWDIEKRPCGDPDAKPPLTSYSRKDSTNNILYLKILGRKIFSQVENLTSNALVKKLVHLPIVIDCISEIGVENRTIDDYTEDVKLHTGGVSVDLETIIDYKGMH